MNLLLISLPFGLNLIFTINIMAEKIISIPSFSLPARIDQVGIEERAARFTKRSIKKETKLNGLLLTLNMIDLTTLEGKDSEGKVKQMCYKAVHLHDAYPGLPTVAAVCVYPSMVAIAKKAVGNSGVKVASVATAFPGGQSSRSVKISDVKFAVQQGADEIDMVISRGKFLEGEYNSCSKRGLRYSKIKSNIRNRRIGYLR